MAEERIKNQKEYRWGVVVEKVEKEVEVLRILQNRG